MKKSTLEGFLGLHQHPQLFVLRTHTPDDLKCVIRFVLSHNVSGIQILNILITNYPQMVGHIDLQLRMSVNY